MVDRILRNNVDIVDAATSGADEIASGLERDSRTAILKEDIVVCC